MIENERCTIEGILDPEGDHELCGCGDVIFLGAGKCENCRVVDEMFGVTDE